MNRDDLGLSFTLKMNLISEDADQRGSVKYDFGVNKVPTREETDKALEQAIGTFNEALNVDDARLVTVRDFGFAEPRNLAWPPVDAAPSTDLHGTEGPGFEDGDAVDEGRASE